MSKPVIEVKNLEKVYEGAVPVRAVNGISLTITQGEFTALKGPSGCGKTTLLNMLGGLDQPTAGSIAIGGVDITTLSENALIDFRLRNIGFVFQAYNLIPVLSAQENVSFIMLLQNRPKEEREARAQQLLEAVGLNGKEDKRPGQLSGGQQQRVAVARALASKPQFVLADEPTANLDSQSTANLLDIMERLNKEEGMTFVFATHDDRVIKKARRIISIEDGKVLSDD
ncbi:MAG: ABC transporter ATP-binding protein [Schleiferiaceae bacterium]|jgi:putative ABC transport system ATP-binding protein|nr:ABC transporter ATP-binding protein [Schleiferiaceae bacterium]MDP4758403.1 ABC transporter ATP-binding protein [Schleiferiaceae bacterium]MDP4767141.1 ABC transporter ATP-binding protein [Schleiferiaceae bacterium]MDP4958478.1 ABC transporter ATP-binding protein [Schleiferiaceae bacterium]